MTVVYVRADELKQEPTLLARLSFAALFSVLGNGAATRRRHASVVRTSGIRVSAIHYYGKISRPARGDFGSPQVLAQPQGEAGEHAKPRDSMNFALTRVRSHWS